MSEPTDNTAATAATAATENAEEKSLAFSSMMEEPKTGEGTPAPDEDKTKQEPEEDKTSEENEDNAESPDEEVDYSQIKAPEGFNLDKEIMAQISPILKELKCSKENAEKIVAAGAEIYNRALKEQADGFSKKVQEWEKEVRADEVLGNEENIAIANRAVIQFGNERLTKEIIEAGLGNNPAFVRFCYEVGKAICEDTVVNASGSAKASNRNELGEPMLSFKDMD